MEESAAAPTSAYSSTCQVSPKIRTLYHTCHHIPEGISIQKVAEFIRVTNKGRTCQQ